VSFGVVAVAVFLSAVIDRCVDYRYRQIM